MITFAEVSIGTGPSTPCARCVARSGAPVMRDTSTILSELAEVAAACAAVPGPNVSFSGAEPFAHPDLPTLVRGAVDCGFERIRLDTDAGALAQGGNAAGVVSAGVRHLRVSLLGAGADHDTLAGRPGLFESAVAGVSAFRSAATTQGAAVCVTGRVPVCRHNAERLVQAVSAFSALGAVTIEVEVLGAPVDTHTFREAELTAVASGMWLHLPGHSRFPAPVSGFEVSR